MNIALRDVSLSDRYTQTEGTIFLNGNQALVRLLLTQRELDRKAGLNTAGFVSGYRGSPLGGFDMELWKSKDFLKSHSIVFQPGMNEDLAATSVWGTQQIDSIPGRTVDGVFAMWYGKGPGIDRSGDPFKHGNYAGTTQQGGVLVVFGDDHPGKSSTVAHQSEQALAAHLIPVLYPSNVEEILTYGLHGYALSRYTGLWVGLKTVNETVDTTTTVDVDDKAIGFVSPNRSNPDIDIRPRLEYNPQRDETIVIRHRLPLIHEFARANRLDLRTHGKAGAKLGVVATGKAYSDLLDALELLGIDEARIKALGVSIYKVGMIWPVEPTGFAEFASGCDELLFVEEKRAFVEEQAARILFNEAMRPKITGKSDTDGLRLLPSDVQLDPRTIARVLASRMEALGLADEALTVLAGSLTEGRLVQPDPTQPKRIPYFCSGCPHNTSTKVPDGSVALSGIGCHSMAMWMDRDTLKPVQMGAEGANWIGLSNFTKTGHVFQNLGDGTYSHSGLLAIRAAVLAGVNITYKILANDAVAMTGGQPVEGELVTEDIVRQVLAENVKRVVVVSDDIDRTSVQIKGVDVVDRKELPRIQRLLADIEGTTVIVYEQVCAAEKRRRRKRKLMPDPTTRIFINENVCEGCGDCSVQSNCVSVLPTDTPFGRKRKIDQSSCNKDYSCVQGFCPSFVTVEGGKPRRDAGGFDRKLVKDLPEIETAAKSVNVLITGVGGTGVVTIGSVLAMAANLVGLGSSSYNMTGLAQKGGAVFSHLRLTASPDALGSSQVGPASADLVLGCDLITAASLDGLKTYDAGRTRALLSSIPAPTAAFQSDRDYRVDNDALIAKVDSAVLELRAIQADRIAEQVLGDRIGANMLMVGYAHQMGWLPLPLSAIRKSIELNGAAIEFNMDALDLGRLVAVDPAKFAVDNPPLSLPPQALDDTEALIAHRKSHLTKYQNAKWAARYEQLVRRIQSAEAAAVEGSEDLTRAVATNFSKLMSYKDEYEVARLYADTAWKVQLDNAIEGYGKMSLWLAPPLMTRVDPETGRPRKIKFGPWIFTAMGILGKLKAVRGSRLDPFSYTQERKLERALIDQYERDMIDMVDNLKPETLAHAIELARLPEIIRGYGPVKMAAIEKAANQRRTVLDLFHVGSASEG
ncbi:MAG: indolepyruvate ferredoxin oxidoreductase family protein [Hoeflea sp.]|uniref:indolepyruvate ferredoxin oxidoreductase family protein n=1 Tax=Hoeflea sp. TaxID=1940281 RepID=UPI00329895EC